MTCSNNNLTKTLTAIIQVSQILDKYDIENLVKEECINLSEVIVKYGEEVASGSLDISVNKTNVALLLAARDLLAAYRKAITKGSPNGEGKDEVEEVGEAKSQTIHDSKTGNAGNFSQAVRPDETGEGTAAKT